MYRESPPSFERKTFEDPPKSDYWNLADKKLTKSLGNFDNLTTQYCSFLVFICLLLTAFCPKL